MRLPLRLALCLLAIIAPRIRAAADDENVKVDLVVDLTEDGERIEHPTPAHPVYYFPIIKGYAEAGAKLDGQPPPPPDFQVLNMIARELYKQGYRVAHKATPPSLIMMFWWGYKAPITSANGGFVGGTHAATLGGQGGGGAAGINAALQTGEIETNTLLNPDEMKELVLGSQFQSGFGDTEKNFMSMRMEKLKLAWLVPRYYLMVSAIDYDTALHQRDDKGNPLFKVYWTARVSTEVIDHTLADVLPALIKAAGPAFGRKTDGPQWLDSPLPPAHVEAGTPVMKASGTAPAAKP